MAFPASNGSLSHAVSVACDTALQLKGYAQMARTRLASTNVPSREIIEADAVLRSYRSALADIADMPGIVAEAQEQLGAPGLDVAAEFQAMMAGIDNATGWIRTNFPVDAGGFLLAQTWAANGPTDRLFAPAQTAGLRTVLDALIATVA